MTTSGGGAGRGRSARKRGGSGSENPPSGACAKGMAFGRRPQQLEDGELVSGTNRFLAVGQPYAWQAGKFHNLESSAFIRNPKGGDAHGFIFVPEVAWSISRALLT